MNQFTPTQEKVIETWTEKRDNLLREIGILETRKAELSGENTQAGLNLDEFNRSIAEVRGRLAELDALEERKKDSLSIEVAELEARKSRLEGECTEKEKAIEVATREEKRISDSITLLSDAHGKMADQASIVNRVVGEMIQTTQAHVLETKTVMNEIRTVASEIIEKGNENVKQTGVILEKLPRYIFELQKPIPLRRTFAEPKGKQIEPETKK